MFFWLQFPFVRIVIFLVLGIYASTYISIESISFYFLFFFLLLLYGLTYFHGKKAPLKFSSLPGAAFCFMVFLFGIFHFQVSKSRNKPHQNLFDNSFSHYLAYVVEESEEKGKNFRTVLEVLKIKTSDGWNNSSGKIMVYYRPDTAYNFLQYGDKVLVKGKPSPVPSPLNPEEFNYQKYLYHQNIYLQHFLKGSDYKVVKKEAVKNLQFYVNSLRRKSIHIIKSNIQGKQETAIALALVLGAKHELDPEIKHSYAVTGAMHVLAVSGLHVGMIYGIVFLIFGRLKKFKGGTILFTFISLCLLWLYACITGMPASVIRAVTMISVIIISQSFKRQSNTYNSLAIAAVLILLFDPSNLFSVGFQLSFAAVLGILYISPKLYHLFNPESIILDKVWGLTCVSVAAQLATFPISIFYFHQFPLYFFLSNLIVIPAAFGILCLGIVLIVFNFWIKLSLIIGYVLGKVIWLTNQLIFSLEFLPYHIIKGLYFTESQTFLIYSFLFFSILFLNYKSFIFLKLAFIIFLFFFVIDSYRIINQKSQQKMVFYSIQNHTAIDFIKGNNFSSWMDDDLIHDSGKIEYHVKPYRQSLGLGIESSDKKFLVKSLTDQGQAHILIWNNKRILVLEKPFMPELDASGKINFDYVVVRNNCIKSLDEIIAWCNFKILIVDSSNSPKISSGLEREAFTLNLNVHATRSKGALIVDL